VPPPGSSDPEQFIAFPLRAKAAEEDEAAAAATTKRRQQQKLIDRRLIVRGGQNRKLVESELKMTKKLDSQFGCTSDEDTVTQSLLF